MSTTAKMKAQRKFKLSKNKLNKIRMTIMKMIQTASIINYIVTPWIIKITIQIKRITKEGV